jgi:hypothetical protein
MKENHICNDLGNHFNEINKKHIIKQSTHQPWIQQHNKDKFHTKKKPLHPK